jgi:hypothetical protein
MKSAQSEHYVQRQVGPFHSPLLALSLATIQAFLGKGSLKFLADPRVPHSRNKTVFSGRTSRRWNAAMIQFPKVRCGMKIVRANIHNLIDSSMIKQNDY